MTRRLAGAVALFLSLTGTLQAQTARKSNAHVGLIYPISSNGINAPEYTNNFSLHAIAGVSGSETAFCLSGFASVVKHEAEGCIISGFANIVVERAEGVQVAGFMNLIKQEANGAQIAGFMNCTGNATGAQVAGFANVATGDVNGQVGGFINVAQDADVQVGGFANVADDVAGAQVGGFINKAGNVNTQVAGFINIAKDVKGVQMAGFINIAESSDYPIGIINLIKKGEKSIGATIDEDLTTLFTFRSGGRVTYGLLGVGFNLEQSEPLYAMEAGIGAHIPTGIKNFRINAEVAATSLTDFTDKVTFRSAICLMPAFTIAHHLEIFAGPTIGYTNFEYAYGDRNRNNYVWDTDYMGRFHAVYIGGKAGIQLHF